MSTSINEAEIQAISNHPNYKLLSRVPEYYKQKEHSDTSVFIATIIDLETMGMDAKIDEIIELGLLSFSFSNQSGILSVIDTYNELNEPGRPIPEEITKITGITNDDVKGRAIDWELIAKLLEKTHLIICHNTRFDRNFLELQTPEFIKTIIEKKAFGCTIGDIDWILRGYESSKLEYLNFKLGYFYDGHRALTDCWATFNLLIREEGAFNELKEGARKKQTLICAENAPFEKKDLLKERKYRWSSGDSAMPKCWWKTIDNESLSEERHWLDANIYGREGVSNKLKTLSINARVRYSYRAEQIL